MEKWRIIGFIAVVLILVGFSSTCTVTFFKKIMVYAFDFRTLWVVLDTAALSDSLLLSICITNDHGYVPFVVITIRSIPLSWLVTGFVTRVTRRVPHVEQELLTLPEHMSSYPVFSGVRVSRSLVLCVVFCKSLFVFLYFIFWPLYCLLFFDLRFLITPFVSSNFSWEIFEISVVFSGYSCFFNQQKWLAL